VPWGEPEGAYGGTGTISGTVRDADGAPLSGVLVRAIPRSLRSPPTHRPGDGPPADPGYEEAVREFAARWWRERGARRDAVTDADGEYVLAGLADERYSLRAYLESYDLRPATGSSREARPGETVDFTGTQLVAVPVLVLLPDGSVPESVSVSCGNSERGFHLRWTKERGFFRLEPGSWRLQATGGPDDSLRSLEVTVVLEPGTSPDPVTLTLAEAPGGSVVNALRVEVEDPAGDLASAGLRDGDLIVGVDGQEFEDTSRMRALMTLARKKPEAALAVIRGATRLEVAADVSRIWPGGGEGGRLRTVSR
jgi:hypothetical protein